MKEPLLRKEGSRKAGREKIVASVSNPGEDGNSATIDNLVTKAI
jgi:hypothetical protein